MFQNKHVFVAGGRTGFVGVNMAKAILARGATVYAHSLNPSKPSFFEPDTPRLVELCGDLAVAATLPPRVDYVIHCAAHTSGAKEMVTNPVAQITSNLFMNTLLLDAAAKAGVKKFLFISSSAVYPDVEGLITEDLGFRDDPPPTYFGPAWMKRYAEKLAEFYYQRYGMEVLVIRPSNIYGPYSGFDLEHSHVLPALIRKFVEKHDPLEVWGTPDVVRDFIYAEDFVEGALKAFETFQGFEVMNIASGQQYTIGEAVEHIRDLTGYTGTVRYNSSKPMTVRQRRIGTSKAEQRLGFRAHTPFREGLGRTIEWYLSTLRK